MSDNKQNIRRYECCICRRSPEEIDDPDVGDEPGREGTPKIARIRVPVQDTNKSFDICWQCSVITCSTFASTAKYFREKNSPEEPPPLRIA